MFLFSTKQLRYFLNIPTEWNPIDKRVLDLGAGDGRVTKKLAAFYANVHTTEMSQVMEWRLRSRNFIIEDVEAWSSSLYGFDLISVLNLLDRHYNPRKLLRDVYVAALRSNCSVLVAIVLPIDQYVEFHPSKRTNRADVRLKVKGNTIEQQASSLVENEFIPLGFQVVRWTKLPYLCEGDLNRPFYVLEDVVFLLHPLPTETLRLSSSNGFTYVSNEL
ncbi:hypothetical protein Angca_004520 [Angiostrongylus cantonensis]|nr:hypothetical protein Angca_004520 [Angiostrongylus cantonensis]